MTTSLSPQDPVRYRRRARGIVFLAVLCLTAGVRGLADPGTASTVGRELADAVQYAWLSLYALGGGLVIVGVYWPRLPRPELEVFGLFPLMAGFTINLLVLLAIRGPLPDGASMTTMTALLAAIWVAHGRTLDLEDAGRRDRRAADLGPHARAGRELDGPVAEEREA